MKTIIINNSIRGYLSVEAKKTVNTETIEIKISEHPEDEWKVGSQHITFYLKKGEVDELIEILKEVKSLEL